MIRRRRTWKIIAALIFLLTVVLIYFENLIAAWDGYEVVLRVRSLLDLEDTLGYTGKKKILFWNSVFSESWAFTGKFGPFDQCPKYNNCFVTHYRGLVNVEDFDAIFFHGNGMSRKDIPAKRDPRQHYVFVNLESPISSPIRDSFFEDYFNMTLTYRLDSDIPWSRNILSNIDTGEIVAPSQNVAWVEPSYDSLKWQLDFKVYQKDKIAAWQVNDCETPGKREKYVEELGKHVQVNVIGECGGSGSPRCPMSEDCFAEKIEPEYFFYISFENTLCKDYVSENFFKALSHNVIPVVYGGANYSLFAPPHSYIDALDFESPKALASFLIDLSQNKEEYLKYFWWKRIYSVDVTSTFQLVCHICELLNEPKPPKTYTHLSNWYFKDKCPMHDSLNDTKFATKNSRL